MKNIKRIKRTIRRYFKSDFFKARFTYTKYYENKKIQIKNDEVLLQSYDGNSISGNVYYILLELCNNEQYRNLKKYVVADKANYEKIQDTTTRKNLSNVSVIKIHSKEYCKKLNEAKYLINNSTFPSYFIKKEKQIYVNTWHGTPLKAMGRNIKNAPNELGNTQRNFLMADYLLNPNEFTFEHMKNDYMLDNLYKGQYIISGYPRNTAFFDYELKEKIKKEIGIKDQKVVVYMPTWRGSLDNKENDKQIIYTMHMLYELDNKLDENTILYVKLHNYTNSLIDYSQFKKIRQFPEEYETYEFLNIADCLITDYSSVFFDFANTGRKIILYAYDKEEYLKDRGMYLDYDKLPFEITTNIDELVKEIKLIDEYHNYKNFSEEYDKYDYRGTTKDVCSYIFKQIKSTNIKVIDGTTYGNNKRNVLIFGGALSKNGITTALKGLINNIDKKECNYFLSFYRNKVEENKNTINDFKNIDYFSIQGKKDMTISEAISHFLYFRWNITSKWIKEKLKIVYQREVKRAYPNVKFDYVIHYSGYERQILQLFKYINAKKILFVHNDMEKEIKIKSNVHERSFKEALETYDRIAVVRETSKNEIIRYYPEIDKNKIIVVHNLNNIDEIIKKSEQDVEFDNNTYCNISLEELNNILNDDKICKFINIARFSPEKGQDKLIKAFIEYRKQHKDSYLIIIGGNGMDFQKVNELANNNENIIIIKSISNPYPILNKSNLFILSSHYEGLPMTIMEALILDKPVVSTNITGPKEFLKNGYGYLVEDSEKGILEGMQQFTKGSLKTLKKFNAIEFNKKALQEFKYLIK